MPSDVRAFPDALIEGVIVVGSYHPAYHRNRTGSKFGAPKFELVLRLFRLTQPLTHASSWRVEQGEVAFTSWAARNGPDAVNPGGRIPRRRFLQGVGFRLKEEFNTRPRPWYIGGHGQDMEYKYSL